MNLGFFRKRSETGLMRSGYAARVVFYYPGEDGTYLDGAWVKIYHSGVVDINHPKEQVTTHIKNVEIIWKNRRRSKSERSFVLHSFTDKENEQSLHKPGLRQSEETTQDT